MDGGNGRNDIEGTSEKFCGTAGTSKIGVALSEVI
jgi:hypothetical protein